MRFSSTTQTAFSASNIASIFSEKYEFSETEELRLKVCIEYFLFSNYLTVGGKLIDSNPMHQEVQNFLLEVCEKVAYLLCQCDYNAVKSILELYHASLHSMHSTEEVKIHLRIDKDLKLSLLKSIAYRYGLMEDLTSQYLFDLDQPRNINVGGNVYASNMVTGDGNIVNSVRFE